MKKSRLIGAMIALVLASQTSAADLYNLTQISSTVPNTNMQVNGMNNLGQIVGTVPGSLLPNGMYTTIGFVWDPNHGMQTLAPPTGGTHPNDSTAYAINDSGLIAGMVSIGDYSSNDPAVWHMSDPSSPIALTSFTCYLCAGYANAVNNASVAQVVGTNQGGAFLWNEGDTTLTSLGLNAIVKDVNDSGVITGYTSSTTPFIWDLGAAQSQPQLFTDQAGAEALAINNNNQVVGIDATIGGVNNAGFIWDAVNGFRSLDPMHQYARILPRDINNNGDVVGSLVDLSGFYHAFLWTEGGGIQLLNNLINTNDPYYNPTGDITYQAVAINDNGQIAVSSHNYQNVYLFTPTAVPVPPAVWLFSSGLLGLIGIARRK